VLAPAAVLLVGVLLGAMLTLVLQDRSLAGDHATPVRPAGGGGAPAEAPTAAPTQQVLLAWTPDPLPADLPEAVSRLDGVEQVTVVAHGPVGLDPARDDPGFVVAEAPLIDEGAEGAPGPPAVDGVVRRVVPLDVVAVDPATYPAFVPPDLAATFAGLRPGDAVLGRTSAELRGAVVGDVLVLEPNDDPARRQEVTVVAIVDDAIVGGAEVTIERSTGAALGVTAPRYLLATYHGDRTSIEAQIRAAITGPIRFRGPGETPFLRDGDAVLPQSAVKATFGEFAVRGMGAGAEQLGPWAGEHLVEADVPLLGRVRCHRAVLDDLVAALEEIEREHLGYRIDPATSHACWYPATVEPSGGLSRGYWGIAVVLNSAKNVRGSSSVQDADVVAILQAHGFTWGGDFLVPEPAYFEHVGSLTTPADG
jgi:hypothetical protein